MKFPASPVQKAVDVLHVVSDVFLLIGMTAL